MENTSHKILEFASDAGKVLLENGAEISRVEETMERIAENYGEEGEKFFVLSNGIFATGRSYASAEFIPIKGARLDKVVEVNQLSRDISSKKLPLSEAKARLEIIKKKAPKPAWEQYLGAAFGCAAFCALFGGGIADCCASLVAAVLLNIFVMRVSTPYLSKTLGNICAGLLGTILCIIFHSLRFGVNLGNMVVGTLILLIPGVAFTNGLRDVANEDYLAGMTRLIDALMMFLCIAIGVCFAFVTHSWTAGGVIQLSGTVTDSVTAVLPMQVLAAFVGTYSFAILFGVPRRFYLPAGVVGMLGWLVFLAISRYTPAGVFASTFLAATVVAFLSRFAAQKLKCPSTVFLICGIFPLIPGGGVFWSAYYIASAQFDTAMSTGLNAVQITLAIVLGIIIAANVFHSNNWRIKMHTGEKKGAEALKNMNALVGLKSVKDELATLADHVENHDPRLENYVFTGKPGTGKTTVARILAKMYKDLGLLESGHVVEAFGKTLTKELIESAENGILYIDEPYMDRDIISALLESIEEKKGRLVVILAGYPDMMDRFIGAIPALQSRFTRHIHFDDFSAEQLAEIFVIRAAEDDYQVGAAAKLELTKFLREVVADKDENFANARYARSLFEKVINKQVQRLANSPVVDETMLKAIEAEDIKATFEK